jgi:hypothetical protein
MMVPRRFTAALFIAIAIGTLSAQQPTPVLFGPQTVPLASGRLVAFPGGQVALETAPGVFLSVQPDGRLESRTAVNAWELAARWGSSVLVYSGAGTSRYLLIQEQAAAPAQPVPVVQPGPGPPSGILPVTQGLAPREQFLAWVAGQPFGQATLLKLEPTLNAHGWLLTPPNAVGDRTKIHPPGGPWVRVGFGEGMAMPPGTPDIAKWVWIEQSDK